MEASDLYEKLKADLHRFALSISRHEHEANDLIQDALIKSLKETELFSLPEYKQKAWFYRVMKNKLIDERRKEKRLSEWDEEFDIPAQVLAGNHIEIAGLLSHRPAELSDIVFKRYWIGLNSKEIGEQLELPSSTIRYKLHMAIKRLRHIIEMEEV